MAEPYRVEFASAVVERHFADYLAGLDEKARRQIVARVETLRASPRPPGKSFGVLRPPLTIHWFVAQYRLRIGDHRVLYDVDDGSRTVVLIAIRRRSERTYRQ